MYYSAAGQIEDIFSAEPVMIEEYTSYFLSSCRNNHNIKKIQN